MAAFVLDAYGSGIYDTLEQLEWLRCCKDMVMMQFIKKDCLEKDVEERIIVKESQKAAVGIVVGIALFWLLCLGLVAIGICNGEEWNGIFVAYLIAISWTIPILVYTGLSYRFRRLELSGRACSYRNVLGKRIDFMACDVAEVKTKISTDWKTKLYLLGQAGEKLAMVETGMVGFERVVPFFEAYNLSAVWTEEGWVRPKPVKINAYEDELVVKANRKMLWDSYVWVVIFLALAAWCTIWVWRELEFGFLHIGMIGLDFLAIALGMEAVRETKGYLKLRLVLTTGQCIFTDMYGQERRFLFDDLENVQIVTEGIGKGKRKLLTMQLSDGKETVKINYVAGIDNLADVIPFVEYHRRK